MKSKILSVILKQLRSSPDFTLTDIKKYRDLLNSSAKIFKIDKKVDFKKFYLVLSANGDFKGLCPLLVQAGTCEVLQDDAVLLVQKAKKAGVNAKIEIWEEMFHVWHYFSKYLSQGREAVEKIGKFIQTHLMSNC